MKMRFFTLIMFMCMIVISSANVSAQTCNNVENSCSHSNEKGFIKSSMSHSFKIGIKQRRIFNVIMYEGKEYYVSVCGKTELGKIQLKIVSGTDSKLMYDNAAKGFKNNLNLKSDVTQKLIIEVSAPNGRFENNEPECAGLFIASKNISK